MARGAVKPALSLEEAQARLLDLAMPLDTETCDPADALGRYLARPLMAARTQPSADLSAMDGYAVCAADAAGPWSLLGESAAGHPFAGTVRPGQTVRIATGAVMPAGAACVILQEDVALEGTAVHLTGSAPQPEGKHVRRMGMDFVSGATLLEAGTRIGPAQMALAISAGHDLVAVRRRPRIAVLDSGDELAGNAADCGPSQIPASNGAMLAAMTAAIPREIVRLGPVADDLDALLAALDRAGDADVIVTSGGASVGDHDLVRPALERWGARLDFWRVAIKPGKPLLVASRDGPRGRQIVLGLPGNPVSSHVTAYLFLLPLVRKLSGAADARPRPFRARLGSPLGGGGSRREFVRAFWDGEDIVPQSVQDSGALSALAASNALIDRAAGDRAREPGTEVTAYLLENGGIA